MTRASQLLLWGALWLACFSRTSSASADDLLFPGGAAEPGGDNLLFPWQGQQPSRREARPHLAAAAEPSIPGSGEARPRLEVTGGDLLLEVTRRSSARTLVKVDSGALAEERATMEARATMERKLAGDIGKLRRETRASKESGHRLQVLLDTEQSEEQALGAERKGLEEAELAADASADHAKLFSVYVLYGTAVVAVWHFYQGLGQKAGAASGKGSRRDYQWRPAEADLEAGLLAAESQDEGSDATLLVGMTQEEARDALDMVPGSKTFSPSELAEIARAGSDADRYRFDPFLQQP